MHDTDQLRQCCKRDEDINPSFLDVFPADFLPSRLPDTCSFILNTDPSSKGGQHWVAACKIDGRPFYFDSYGRKPSDWYPGWNILNGFKRSTEDFQQDTSDVCGDYCLNFLKNMTSGRSFDSFLKVLDETDDLGNDIAMRSYAHKMWPTTLNQTTHVVEDAYDTDYDSKPPQRGGLSLGSMPVVELMQPFFNIVQINIPRRR